MEPDLKLQFPSIVRNRNKQAEFFGILRTADNEPVLVSFNVPNYPSAQGISAQIGNPVCEKLVKQFEARAETLNFLEYLKLVHATIVNIPKKRKFRPDCFTKFSYEFRQLRLQNPFDKFIFGEKDETLTIKHCDDYDVEKQIKIKIDFYTDGLIYEVVEHNFPGLKESRLFHRQATLFVLFKLFKEIVKSLSRFHDALSKIDDMCWVIAPPDAGYEHNHRTIVIADNNVNMKITLDPWNMSKLPEFRVFGPSTAIEQHMTNISTNLDNWDFNKDILQNILTLLDLPFFPVKPAEPAGEICEILLYDSATECFICYLHSLNDKTPEVVCKNDCCRKQFHNECLYEWLMRLPNCQGTFDSLSGECPNCEKVVSCKIPERKL